MTHSAFSRLFRRPAGIASVEFGFFAAVIAVGLLTILGSIGGPMRIEIDPASPVAVTSAAAPAPAPEAITATAPDTPEPAIAATDTAMRMVEQALVSLETVGTTGADAASRSDIAAHDAAFEKLIQTLLIEETESVAAIAPAEANIRTAAIVDRTPPVEPAAEPTADWTPATGFLPEEALKPMPRPEMLAAN